MCGICGIISKDTIHIQDIEAMNTIMEHRGPDGEGFLISTPFNGTPQHNTATLQTKTPLAFGHRRLSIIDLSDLGHQPMSYQDRYWITYNGEIFNHIELREELESLGHTFTSHSDTEVILAAYAAWGTDCLNKLNGMWAFAIYDTETGTLLLSRDRFGIKPLYYYQDETKFVFASEIKSLIEHPQVEAIPNTSYCKAYIQNGPKDYIKETAFQNIYRFNAASYVHCPLEALLTPIKETLFWDFTPNTTHETFNEEKAQNYAKEYYALLKDAVRLRLRADVKTGAALSGGLDSSSIVYLIDEILKETNQSELQETFSVVHRKAETRYCDESEHIDTVCNALTLKSHTIEPEAEDVPERHEKGLYYLETPPENISLGGMSLCKLVKENGVTVTLDGQGADEQQAGYMDQLSNYLIHLPFWTAVKESRAILNNIEGVQKRVRESLIVNVILKLIPAPLLTSLVKRILKKDISTPLRPLNTRLKHDLQSGLVNLLHYSDSRSMGYSLESRVPFMDYRLVEFMASIPAVYKVHNGWTKYFARRAFEGKLPDSIVWRKDKMGWLIPNDYWFKGPMHTWLTKTITESPFVKKLYPNLSIEKTLKTKHIYYTLRYLNLSVWHKLFFTKKEA